MRRLILALALVAGCSKTPVPAAPEASVESRADLQGITGERGNLLNMALGAAVVSRTGELTLDNSAAAAIDGENATTWSMPPADINQTAIYALPAPTLIESLSVLTPQADPLRVNNLSIESSTDGKTFAMLAEPALKASADPQSISVTPVEARYLRVTVTGAAGSFPAIQSLQVRGSLLAAPQATSIAGCWTVNGEPATFTQNGGSISGRMGSEVPTVMTGGIEGAVYRVTWVRGPDHGVAAFTVAPDGSAISGIHWFETARPTNTGGAWLGEKTACATVSNSAARDVVATFLERNGSYPLYGIQFDKDDRLVSLDAASLSAITTALAKQPSKKIQLTAREYRSASFAANAHRAQKRIDALRAALAERKLDMSRIELVAAGAETALFPPMSDLIRLMHSRVEISVK